MRYMLLICTDPTAEPEAPGDQRGPSTLDQGDGIPRRRRAQARKEPDGQQGQGEGAGLGQQCANRRGTEETTRGRRIHGLPRGVTDRKITEE